jgi:cytochrome c551/c552
MGKPLPKSSATEPEEETDLDEQREKWVKVGGWYRQDLDYIVRYRPMGHEDNFLRAWLDISSQYQTQTAVAPLGEIYSILSHRKAVGLCMKCHSVDTEPGQPLRINWVVKREAPAGPFTVFAHTPHFSLLHKKECLACHILNTKADVMAGFSDTNPYTFTSSFQPMKKTLCANCHTASDDGDQCITCHRYHRETIPPVVIKVPLGTALSSDAADTAGAAKDN